MFFFFNDTATTEIYTLSLHDALPISGFRQDHAGRQAVALAQGAGAPADAGRGRPAAPERGQPAPGARRPGRGGRLRRSEEHTSELQSRQYLVCRLLLEKKKNKTHTQ